MIGNYWSCCNNDVCKKASIIFLQKLGLTKLEIQNWLHIEHEKFPVITNKDKLDFEDEVNSTMNIRDYR